MKRYDTYKPSGSRWIGDIPGHWELRRIRYLVKDNGESIKIGPFGSSLTGKVISDGDYKVYGQWNIIGKDFSAGLNTVTEETYNNLINYQIVEDDILISMMGTVGKCATIPRGIQKGIMDSHVIKIRLNQSIMKSDFFEYVYDKDNSNVVFPQIQEIKKGSIMDGLNSSLLKDFMIPVPPLAEQESIAAYLDARCADIDKVVATQQKRIALLQELKQSEITQAVTRGLNPDARMKDSGVEWIGMVPEEWEVRRIRHLVKDDGDSIKIGPFGSSLTGKVIADGAYKVYGQWNIIGKDFTAGLNTVTEETFNNLINYQIIENDILISMMGTVGKCATIPKGIQKGIMDSHVIKIRLNQSIMRSDFFEYVYDKDNSSIVYSQIQEIKKGSIMDGLNSSLLKDFKLPVPSVEEQTEIVEYLDHRCGEIDKQIGAVTKQIELLREYKQALITEVVTGKFRV